MSKQKSPHTQTQQNVPPERTDMDSDQQELTAEDRMYEHMEGAETGTNRSVIRAPKTRSGHKTEPEAAAHEGSLTSRTPKKGAQGIASHSVEEESERQKKVVNERPDAQAGVNHSK